MIDPILAPNKEASRRPLASRSNSIAIRIAAALARSAITRNQISLLSMVFALLGAVLLLKPTPLNLIAAAVCIQLRLLCNLLDGMVAMEGGKASAVGALYNDVPDRIADPLLIVAAGYACGYPELGWLASLLAVLTAYIRLLGASVGLAQDFRGPMAKPQRMAVLTLACFAGAAELHWRHSLHAITAAVSVIALGALVTCGNRLWVMAAALKRGAKVS